MKKIIHILSALLILSSCAIAKKKNKQIPYGAGTYLIETTQGNITVRTFEETPLHSKNFDSLVRAGFYDGLLFHRVIPQFMIQGGDPKSKDAPAGTPLGSGDVGYRVPAEFSEKIYHKRGALAAARDGNPEKASSGCQFYIVQGKKMSEAEIQQTEQRTGKPMSAEMKKEYMENGGTAFLDMGYTVFGETLEGVDVVEKITLVPRSPMDRPNEDVKIISIKRVSEKK
ncbi:MAG: peptidylprolyl isomerase [Chitinophagaceae bacterium]|nr:peptidylprolyl isomerase [Chitinophagaceae bacterium]